MFSLTGQLNSICAITLMTLRQQRIDWFYYYCGNYFHKDRNPLFIKSRFLLTSFHRTDKKHLYLQLEKRSSRVFF